MVLTEQELKGAFCVTQEEVPKLVNDRAEELTMEELEELAVRAAEDAKTRQLGTTPYEKMLFIARYAFLLGYGEAMLTISEAQQYSMEQLKEAKAA